MQFSFQFPPAEDAPAQARAALEVFDQILAPDVLEDLQLVVSELVTNSVKFGPKRAITLACRLHLLLTMPIRVSSKVLVALAVGRARVRCARTPRTRKRRRRRAPFGRVLVLRRARRRVAAARALDPGQAG